MATLILSADNRVIHLDNLIEETDTEFRFPDLIIPKTVIPGYTTHDVTLPNDYVPGKYKWDANTSALVLDNTWKDPSVMVPDRVSPYQARMALENAGLLTTVNSMVSAANTQVQLSWTYSNEIHRESPFIVALGSQLGLTNTQIDQLFIAAAQIT